MTGSTQIQTFAIGAGANVLSPAAYAALAAVSTGYQSGIAESVQFNTTLRQTSFMSAALANFVAAQGLTQNDDGNLTNAVSNIAAAIKTLVGSPTVFTGGTTTGTASAQVLATLNQTGFSLQNGYTVIATSGFTNTGAFTYDVLGTGNVPVKELSGSSLIDPPASSVVASQNFTVVYNSTAAVWVLQTTAPLGAVAYLALGNNVGNDGSNNLVGTIPPITSTAASLNFATAQWGADISRSNGGSAMTDTLPGTSGALGAGWYTYVTNNDTSSSDTIGVGAGGSIKQGNTSVTTFSVLPGEKWLIESKGSGVYTVGRIQGSAIHGNVVQGEAKNLKIVSGSGTAGTITADAISVMDANGNSYRLRNVNQSYATGTSGAGGLDTGSFGASAWYYEYIIFNPSANTVSSLLSLSSTAPTLPTGYTAFARVGARWSNGSSQLYYKVQYGRRAQVVSGSNPSAPLSMASGATSSAWTAVDIRNFVPPTSSMIIGYASFQGDNYAMAVAPNGSGYGAGSNGLLAPAGFGCGDNTFINNANIPFEFSIESTNIYYTTINNGGSLNSANVYLLGWEDNL